MTFLAGDAGGTKVNLALCELNGSKITANALLRYPSAQFKSLDEIIDRYLLDAAAQLKTDKAKIKSRLKAACFGVPGPVIDGRCQTLNLPWTIDVRDVKQSLGLKSVGLINDLESMAYGIRTLREGEGLKVLRAAEKVSANQALIAPGTGLGEALIIWHGDKYMISPSEGGHCDFAPHNDEHIELLRSLWKRHKHVSWEHVASGPGIYRIYRFLRDSGREEAPADLEAALKAPNVDPSPLITSRALRGDSEICIRAVDMWMFFVGAEAGNLALKSMCRGGLFLGGGVIPHIIELFNRPSFFEGFESKGRMSGIIKKIPIFAVTDQYAALYGAALTAREL